MNQEFLNQEIGWKAPSAPPMTQQMSSPFYIQSVETGLVVHIKDENPDCGGEVVMQIKNGSPAQLWTYNNNAICSVLNDAMVLDVEEGTGPNVITYEAHFGPNQMWNFKDQECAVVSSTGEVLDIEGGSTEPGAQVIVWEEHGGPNQKFIRVYV